MELILNQYMKFFFAESPLSTKHKINRDMSQSKQRELVIALKKKTQSIFLVFGRRAMSRVCAAIRWLPRLPRQLRGVASPWKQIHKNLTFEARHVRTLFIHRSSKYNWNSFFYEIYVKICEADIGNFFLQLKMCVSNKVNT